MKKPQQAAPARQRSLGVLLILGAALSFSVMNLFVRLAGDLPTFEKAFFRNLISLFVACFLALRQGGGLRWQKGSLPALLARAGFGTLGLLCNFYAVDHMNISDASLLNKLSPFFAIIFSYFVLQETASGVEWLSVLAAFVGAAFVVKPTAGILTSLPALVGLVGGAAAGMAYTFVRRLGRQGERVVIVVLFFSAFSTLVTLPLMLAGWQPMTAGQLGWLLCAGAAASAGQLCITGAYTCAPAREIGVFDYTQVLFSAVLGFFFLNQLPDLYSMIGYCIIIGVAFAKWRYNLKH